MTKAKEMIGKKYRVEKPFRIGNCKMKDGDILTIQDYSCGSVSYVVSFTNSRLPHYKFRAGDWVIRGHAKLLLT